MLKKKITILFFPQFIEQFKKFFTAIYSKSKSKIDIFEDKGVIFLANKGNHRELFDNDDIVDNLEKKIEEYFDISYVFNNSLVNKSLSEKINYFNKFVLINYPKNEKELFELIDDFSLINEKDNQEDNINSEKFSSEFRIILLYMDYETIKDIREDYLVCPECDRITIVSKGGAFYCSANDSHSNFSSDKIKKFNKDISDYFEITKNVIDCFINKVNDGDSSKVSIITIKNREDLLSGDLIKKIWNSII